MKRLKSSAEDIRDLFTTSITARHIAEALVSFDADRSAAEVRTFMKKKDFDVIGVRHDGQVSHYANRNDLVSGTLGDFKLAFEVKHLVPESAPLLKTIEMLAEPPRVFVLVPGEVRGIVTRGDLQKVPVRMWLFGLISLVEMQLVNIIRNSYLGDSWKTKLSKRRRCAAKKMLADRLKRNQATELVDCLQFCDKRDIVLKTRELQTVLGFESRARGERLLRDLEHVRDELAHSQDIVTANWPDVLKWAKGADQIIRNCEEWTQRGTADQPAAN